MDSDAKPCKVIQRPGIPVPQKPTLNCNWVLMWTCAVLLLLSAPLFMRATLYSQTDIKFVGEAPTLAVKLQGCDVLFAPGPYLELRLGYWTFMGSGHVERKGNDVSIEAYMDQKMLAFHCLLVVTVPKSSGPHFKSLNITVEPSNHALTAPQPSNVAETISVHLAHIHVQDSMYINVSTMAETTIHDTMVPTGTMLVKGGSLTVTDSWGGAGQAARSLNVSAENALVLVRTANHDVALDLDAEALASASLAAANLSKGGVKDDVHSFFLSRGSDSGERPLHLSLNAQSSAVYVFAADEEHMGLAGDGSCPQLAVHRGELAAKGPSLTEQGTKALEDLKEWLKNPVNSVEFAVYIHVPAPKGDLSGLLKLLSSEVYTALSPIGFALLSGGAMEPYVIRIALPIVGINWAFPDRACDAAAEVGQRMGEGVRFGNDVLALADTVVSLPDLGLKAAKWVWQTHGQDRYLFDHVPSRNGRRERWQPRRMSAGTTFAFRAAAGITVAVGLLAGWGICKLLYIIVRPEILDIIRKADIFSTASYRLMHTSESILWVVAATFVQWPMGGVLLRWKKRPMAPQFASFSFVARPWPLGLDSKSSEIVVKNVNALRLPTYPSLPDQECFLFAAWPHKKKHETPWFPEAFDTELFATGMLQCGVQQPRMKVGKPYQFQVVAYNAAGKVVERSQWSRPTITQPQRAFTEFPLLLWRSIFGHAPQNTFDGFLLKFCKPIQTSPSLVLSLSKFRLAAVTDSTLFWGEELGVYGEEDVRVLPGVKAAPTQEVSVAISAGGLVPLYESTRRVPLPTQEDRLDNAAELVLPFDKALPGRQKGALHGLEFAKFVMLDFKNQVIQLPVGYDQTTVIRIEAVVNTLAGQAANTAMVEMTWGQILQAVSKTLAKVDSKGKAEPVPVQDIVLRDGLTPVGVLSFECGFSNSILGDPAPPPKQADAVPEIFQSVVPGSAFLWGETTSLDWDDAAATNGSLTFEVVLVAEGCHGYSHGKKVKTETVIAKNVSVGSGKLFLTLCPVQPVSTQAMRCYFEARRPAAPGASGGQASAVLASSWEFLITRPVTMQQLELGYSAFCIRNRIPMQPLPKAAMSAALIELAERRVYYVNGYRLPLPLPAEKVTTEFDPDVGPTVVLNPASSLICDPHGLAVPTPGKAPAPAPAAPQAAPGDNGKQNLVTPLLEAGQAAPAPVPTKTILPKEDAMTLTTNVFWNWSAPTDPELLLKYWFVPAIAEPGHHLMGIEWQCRAINDTICFLLGTLIYYMQLSVIALPGVLLFAIWLWHDTVLSKLSPDMMPTQDAHRLFLIDFLISPAAVRWQHIDDDAKVVCVMLHLYVLVVTLLTFYCNFFHGLRDREGIFFSHFNSMVSALWSFFFFMSVVLVTVVLVWVLMGALINPSVLMPYAIMLVTLAGLYYVFNGKLTEMKDHVIKGIHNSMDVTLRAIFEVFVEDPAKDAAVTADIARLKALADVVSENMAQAEEELMNKLLEQSEIQTSVYDYQMHQMATLRASPAYQTLEGRAKNKTLITDFAPGVGKEKAEILQKAQEIAIEETTIEGTNMLGTTQTTTSTDEATGKEVTTTAAATAPPITAAALGKAIASCQEVMLQRPGEITSQNSTSITKLARQLFLREKTAKSLFTGYSLQLHRKRVENRPPALQDALTCSSLFCRIRRDRLFSHFVEREVEGPDGQKATESNFLKLLNEFQNVEMESLNAKAATALTKQLDWTKIGRQGETYVLSVLQTAILSRVTDEQLSPVIEGSAAFTLVMQVFDLAFTRFDAVYKNDPTQIFVDCGVVEDRYRRAPRTKRVLTEIVDGQRAFDLSLSPDNLVNAVKVLCFPDNQLAAADDIPGHSYLWYGALVKMLEKLGWTQDEMKPAWLSRMWRKVTGGTGLFEYEGLDEVNDMIMSLSGDGLWKAAAKGLMLHVGLGGYLGCDITRDGLKEAAKAAHNLRENVDWQDLEAVAAAAGAWPDYVEDLWRRNAKASGGFGPYFLPTEKVEDFLMDLAYLPLGSGGAQVKLTPLSPYAEDCNDLVWQMGSDKAIWHTLPTGNRRLRGLWLELALELFLLLDSVPRDIDIFYKALNWQVQQRGHPPGSPWLRLTAFDRWLREDYFKALQWCTFSQFNSILCSMLNCDLPEGPLRDQVFAPCPVDPEDDLGELRRIADLGAALHTWLGFGLWPAAVGQVVEELIPRGPVRTQALSILPEEFKNLDQEGLGMLQPGEALVLLHRLVAPGLTCEDMTTFVGACLGANVPERELHKYFTMMDVNCDGVLSAEEFIPMLVYLVFDYFPHHILKCLNLSRGKIISFLITVLSFLAMLFALITLAISAFPTGRGIASTIHSAASGMSAYCAKQMSDKSIGYEDTMTNLKKQLEQRVLEALATVLGLSKAVLDRVVHLLGQGKPA